MALPPSDVASLARSLTRWEDGEYVCAALVTIACAGEYVATFKNWFTGGIKERKERLEKRATLLLIFALTFELICLFRTNHLSGMAIGSLSDKAEEASTKSQEALETAGKASFLALGARQEADSFEKDIVSAKEQAATAESHLADALQRTARLEQELTWRTLTPSEVNTLCSNLASFAGTKITIESLSGDAEGSEYAQDFANALRSTRCGWIVDGPTSVLQLGRGVPEGLFIDVSNVHSRPGIVLQHTLGLIGITAPGRKVTDVPTDAVRLFVAPKPGPKHNKKQTTQPSGLKR